MPPPVAIGQRDFSAGVMRSGAPFATDLRSLFDLINGLYGDDASAFKRGGTENLSTSAFGSAGLTWMEDAYFDVGRRTVFAKSDDFGVLDASEGPVNLGGDGLSAPAVSAMLGGILFIGGGYMYGGSRKTASYTTTGSNTNLTNGSTTVTDASGGFTANVDAGMLLQRGNERVYVVASVDSDTQLTLRDEYEGVTTTTANPVLHNIYEMTGSDPYTASSYYAVVANRLAYADGNEVHLSEVDDPHDWTATIVGGSPSSVPTIHELPEGVRILGFATIGQTLLIFTTGGVWALSGLAFNIVDANGNNQHRLDLVSRELILFSATGVTTYRGQVIAPFIDGVYLIDGVSAPVLISGPVTDLWQTYVERGYRAGNAIVYRGHYFLPIVTASGGDVKDCMVWRVERPVDTDEQTVFPFSRFAGEGGRLVSFAVRRLDSSSAPLLLGAEVDTTARVVDCSGYFNPTDEGTDDLDADETTFAWTLVSRDFETPNDTENMVRHLHALYELQGGTLSFEYGFGLRTEGGTDLWDAWDWADAVSDDPDDLYWADEEDDVWFTLDCTGEENDGTEEFRCRINAVARRIRIRVKNTDGGILRFRQFQLWVRPSRAVRR